MLWRHRDVWAEWRAQGIFPLSSVSGHHVATGNLHLMESRPCFVLQNTLLNDLLGEKYSFMSVLKVLFLGSEYKFICINSMEVQ